MSLKGYKCEVKKLQTGRSNMLNRQLFCGAVSVRSGREVRLHGNSLDDCPGRFETLMTNLNQPQIPDTRNNIQTLSTFNRSYS